MGQFDYKHGMWDSSEYKIWTQMKQRCHNKNCANYKNYGAKGVTVCDEWRESFERFYNDMGPRPSKNHSIDRINVYGEYSKANCQWSERSHQNRNTRKKAGANKFRGVSFCKVKNKFKSYIRIEGKQVFLGYFSDEVEAAIKHDNYCYSVFKNPSYLNFKT